MLASKTKNECFIHNSSKLDNQVHRTEIFILVCKVYENIYLLFSVKNALELEGIINSRESSLVL